MNRIILSRKGFDSSAGGAASPILEDGGIYSIPIPWKIRSPNKYKDAVIQNKKVLDLLSIMKCNTHFDYKYCHYDPDLRYERGIFGQANAAQTELENNGVGVNDLFLFFGWFKKYALDNKDLHHIFGWLQVEKIIRGDSNINNYLDRKNITHPHGHLHNKIFKNNTIYVGARDLKINNSLLKNKGYGMFTKTNKQLILTEQGKSRSNWRLPKRYFRNTNKLFLNRLKWKDAIDCRLQCQGQGQEYILNAQDNPLIKDWAENLIKTCESD
tara:strand:+ start:130 stop:936 length:807 start_codon:yes stop_codon:yes gene_type:complete